MLTQDGRAEERLSCSNVVTWTPPEGTVAAATKQEQVRPEELQLEVAVKDVENPPPVALETGVCFIFGPYPQTERCKFF